MFADANPFGPKKTPVQKTIAIPKSVAETTKIVAQRPELSQVQEIVEEVVKVETPRQKEEIDEHKVKLVLDDLVEEFRSKGKNLEATLLKQPFKLENESLVLLLNGEIQEEIFSKAKGDLQQIFRAKLRNDQLSVHYEIKEEAVPEGKRLYTSTDKLNYLLEKHGALRELQRKFNLETDF
ncbi:DNA polymerase III subunit gamma/tau [Belliella sp. DSM 111904]|uniref:DNA polymerase III subunit gamma/tau n=1 Tax=Belliella filtrata TaxID=2923435 RepID=A0ABS9V584_9BACT|nr:DNA polymerase III subunit gamma/tau [Belliella filtrata]MCH7411582.1 DNA polymerase III subunit gamma/tau [Belliella filtrata]